MTTTMLTPQVVTDRAAAPRRSSVVWLWLLVAVLIGAAAAVGVAVWMAETITFPIL